MTDFSGIQFFALFLFVLGYIAIALEHKIGTSKSAIALVLGGVLWILASLEQGPNFSEEITRAGADIIGIVIFLLAAMSLVEVLIHYKFFDIIREKLFRLRLGDRGQFVVICCIAFFISAIIDNLTTTIVMIQIARKFFKGENLLRAGAGIVIAANAGGAFSPIGDVTTIMLWLAGKFTAYEILVLGFLPALALLGVMIAMMYRTIEPATYDATDEVHVTLESSERRVIQLVFLSFAFPVVMNAFTLPPYLGLLIGLGLVWLAIDFLKRMSPHSTHLEASIEDLIRKTDISSLKFFIGILLAVSALHTLGILEVFSHIVYGNDPTTGAIVRGNILLGMLSAVVDNVPLTAIAIQVLDTTSMGLWVLLALAVGTGGSLLVIGSAAGVVAMGMLKELTFATYFKIAFLPALGGFVAAITVWSIEYFVLGL